MLKQGVHPKSQLYLEFRKLNIFLDRIWKALCKIKHYRNVSLNDQKRRSQVSKFVHMQQAITCGMKET